MPQSYFPKGFKDGISINGIPLAITNPGLVYCVNSGAVLAPNGTVPSNTNGFGKTFAKPFSTIAYALTQCIAGRGDIILVAPGHVETIADAVTFQPVQGVTVIGLGKGTDRPTLTWSATTSTIPVSVANFSLFNFLTKVSINSVAVCFTVTAANFLLDSVDYQLTASKSPISYITTTASGTDMTIQNCHHYQDAAVAVTTWISLVGANRATIFNNYMAINASTAIIGGATTASLDVLLDSNAFYNQTSTVACVVMFAGSTGIAYCNSAGGAKTALAGNMGLANLQGYQNFSSHTANKNGLLDPVVDA